MDRILSQAAPFGLPERAAKTLGHHASRHLLTAAFVGDIVVVFLALAASSWLRFESPLADWGFDARSLDWTSYRGHVLLGTALFGFLCLHFRIYTVPLVLGYRRLLALLLNVAGVWLVAGVALAYVLRADQPLSRLYVILAFTTSTAALLLWRRGLSRVALRAAATGRLRRRVLFVDWSAQADTLAEAMACDRRHLFEIVGCVAPEPGRFTQPPPLRVRRLDGLGSLAALLASQRIDTVILADLNPPDGIKVRLANLCEKEMVEFKVIPCCFEILTTGLHLETVGGVPLLGLSQLPLDSPFNAALKQAVDFVGALAGLVLSAPLIAVATALVYRESPGPVFYRQRRLGRDGSHFWLYKIRSMRLDAERDGQPGWSTRDDPRRLRIGAFLRRWNIDETPQFWNVLKGDMSLVGPRPERPELIVSFKEEIPHYNARHHIKPGITGWAQINGFRGDTDLRERIRCDLFYIENWSLLLDLQIMLVTLFKHKNAC